MKISEILLESIICFPFILPFAGVGIIETYRNDKLGRFAGFFILKQLIDNTILWLPVAMVYSKILENSHSINLFLPILVFSIPILLTLAIIYPFRSLFKNNLLPWLFLTGDILCWIARCIYYGNMDDEKEFFGEISYLFLAFYPALALVVLLIRHYLSKRTSDSVSA